MTANNAKAPNALTSVGAPGFLQRFPASEDRVIPRTLDEVQFHFVARRTRLAPDHARVVASLAFGGVAA